MGAGRRQILRLRLGLAGVVSALVLAAAPAHGQSACQRSDFETVVDEAAAALRDLTTRNSPTFQDLLRQLKQKRGWNQETFLTQAAPFVRDEQIIGYDQKSERLLAELSRLGETGASQSAPDCAMLAQVKSTMKNLIEMQQAKWAYMFDRVKSELAK